MSRRVQSPLVTMLIMATRSARRSPSSQTCSGIDPLITTQRPSLRNSVSLRLMTMPSRGTAAMSDGSLVSAAEGDTFDYANHGLNCHPSISGRALIWMSRSLRLADANDR